MKSEKEIKEMRNFVFANSENSEYAKGWYYALKWVLDYKE